MTFRGLVFLALLAALSLACSWYVTGRSLEAAGLLRRPDGTVRRGLRSGVALALFGASLLPLLGRFGFTRDQAWSEVLSATGFFVVLGASSTTFWWRRWIEHSRSPSTSTRSRFGSQST